MAELETADCEFCEASSEDEPCIHALLPMEEWPTDET